MVTIILGLPVRNYTIVVTECLFCVTSYARVCPYLTSNMQECFLILFYMDMANGWHLGAC